MTYENVDKGVVDAIRRVLIEMGYLPDKLLYATKAEYLTALAAIKAGGKQVIEIYGVGNAEKKDENRMHTIVVTRSDEYDGSCGAWPEFLFDRKEVTVGGTTTVTYDKYFLPDKMQTVEYEIRYITNSADYDRIINQVLQRAIGNRKYLKAVNEDALPIGEVFLFERKSYVDVSTPETMEKLMRYNAVDLWLQEPYLLSAGVPAMIQADLNVKPTTDLSQSGTL